MKNKDISRRKLFEKIVFVPFFGLIAQTFLQSCKASSTTTATSGASCPTVGASVGVGSDHGHAAVSAVPWTDIDLAIQQTYAVGAGSAGHSHTFTVSATDMTTMKTSSSIVILTTDADSTGHSHTITMTCTH